MLTTHTDKLAVFVGLNIPAKIEGHLVFQNPVPMQFYGAHIGAQIQVHIFANLDVHLARG